MNRKNARFGPRTRRPDFRVIAAITLATAAVISGSCLFGTATNLCEQSGRRCSPGQTCAAHQDICVDIGGCGDGIIDRDKGEVCDDGNIIAGDGCSADCKSDETCGNHIIDVGSDSAHPKETCDDGNTISGDGCSADCIAENCGDGIFDSMNKEDCDTKIDTQACNGGGTGPQNCKIPRCGDGYTNPAFMPFLAMLPEQCDEGDPTTGKVTDSPTCNGNRDGHDGPGSCRNPTCGDLYANTKFTPPDAGLPEECDTGVDTKDCNGNNNGSNGSGSCRKPSCGDRYTNTAFTPTDAGPPESCDEGSADTQGCNGNDAGGVQCQIAQCGDNYMNTAFHPTDAGPAESCDNGSADTKGCNGSSAGAVQCQVPRCGDGYTNNKFAPTDAGITDAGISDAGITESCDNGSNDTRGCNGTSAGTAQCQVPRCGDGYVNGAFAPTDGGTEQCDPGNGSDIKAVNCSGGKSCTVASGCRCF